MCDFCLYNVELLVARGCTSSTDGSFLVDLINDVQVKALVSEANVDFTFEIGHTDANEVNATLGDGNLFLNDFILAAKIEELDVTPYLKKVRKVWF